MHPPAADLPTAVALRNLTRGRKILEEVVISSESFDYRKAKQGLKDLSQMIRELAREEARLRATFAASAESSAQIVPFPESATDALPLP